jgi:capsular exopolysaccharide synthesis family protein
VTRLAEALRRAEDAAPDGPTDDRHDQHSLVASAGADRPPDAGPLQADRDKLPGIVQRFSPSARGKLIVTPSVPSAAIEQYRRLAASLHHTQLQKETKVVMITSASPGEGKTLTSVNLALTLSQSYLRNVLLIDADLRRPNVHQLFQVPNVFGLSEGLKSDTEEKLSLIQVSEYLTVLPAGRPDPDPMGGLTSERMRRIVQQAAARFDWVLIDTPPVGFLSDANLLVAMVDTAIFVVRAGKSPYRLIQRALDAVGRNRILGVVLNAVAENVDVAGYNYYGYYGAPSRSEKHP